MGLWQIMRGVLTAQPDIPVQAGQRGAFSTTSDHTAIAAEIVAAEKATGKSHWDVGVEIAERHGLSVFDVHDEYMKELDRVDRVQTSRDNHVKIATIDVASLKVLDLREVGSTRTRIKGSEYWMSDSARARFGDTEYLLLREPKNRNDANAVAVYGKGRKVGYVSAAKAAALAPILDPLPFDAFKVGGASVMENSIRLWVDLPRLGEMREFLKRLNRRL